MKGKVGGDERKTVGEEEEKAQNIAQLTLPLNQTPFPHMDLQWIKMGALQIYWGIIFL